MKNKTSRLWTLIRLLVGSAAVPAAFAQAAVPSLDVPNASLAKEFNWPGYWARFAPVFAEKIGFPTGVATIHIIVQPDPTFNWWSNNGGAGNDTVYVPQYVLATPPDLSHDDFGVDFAVIRELANLKIGAGAADTVLGEGFDDAAVWAVYSELARQGFNVVTLSGLSSMRMANNLPRDCKAGNNVFLSMTESQNDSHTVGAWLVLMSNGNLAPLAAAFETLSGQILSGKAASDGSAAIALLDRMFPSRG